MRPIELAIDTAARDPKTPTGILHLALAQDECRRQRSSPECCPAITHSTASLCDACRAQCMAKLNQAIPVFSLDPLAEDTLLQRFRAIPSP